MTLVPLTRKDHAALRLNPARAAQAAASVHLVPLVRSEIRKITGQFPVFLAKDGETGEFYPAALMGLEPHENLFWAEDRLEASRVPLNLLRLPFFIGHDGAVMIDMASPAVDANGPVALLNADGSDSAWFTSVQAMLGELAGGQAPTRALVDTVLAHGLVQEVKLDLRFHNGTSAQLSGLYGLDEAALGRALPQIADIDTVMVLAAMVLSLDHVATLVKRKNARLAAMDQWLAPQV
ncbi:MAG: SapC family protein [Sphingomonadales bacterium]|nr:SapC family protein [Sphingomonadales bacterium]MDE2169437.1 SapC family protein [Sphingomonadales bacterium]